MPARRPARTIPALLATIALIFFAIRASAQGTEPEINARLLKKPLYLRGLWAEDSLKFDPDGTILGKFDHRPFAVCGVDIHHVQIKKDKLILSGVRAALEFAPKLKRLPLEESIQIEIAAPPSGDYGPALDQIFANDLADLTPSLPSFWQKYARKNFLPQPDIAVEPAPLLPRSIGVTPPSILKQTDPAFSPLARQFKYGGDVILGFVVRTDGSVADISIITPLGLGMDEQAVVALLGYRFKPAMQNGQPVATELRVNINFQIFSGP